MDDGELRRREQEGIRLEQSLRWREAEKLYRALLLDSALDARSPGVANIRLRHAYSLLVLKEFGAAQAEFDRALEAAKAAGDPLTLGRALLGGGVFAASRGDIARGEDFLLAALEAFHRSHDQEGRQGEGWALLNLAAVYGKTKRLDLAFLTFEKARERLFAVENWVGVATAWEMQAELREALGDLERGRQDFHEAMSFYQKEGMREKVAQIRDRLGGRAVV